MGVAPGLRLRRAFRVSGILAGIFPTDDIDSAGRVASLTSVGAVPIVASAAAFAFGTAGMFMLSRTFKRDARWQAVWPWSSILALVALVGFIVAVPSVEASIGLIQRIFVGTVTLWQVHVALQLRSTEGGSAEQPPRVR